MAQVAGSAVPHCDFDDDDISSITLDHMSPQRLTLLVLDQDGIDSFRDKLLPQHGISARSVLFSIPTLSLVHDQSFLVMSSTSILLQPSKQVS
jgi:hypothetical protein